MIKLFKKIPQAEKSEFSMPLSLRLMKECASYNIDWRYLHIADLFSIIYSMRIDNAKNYLAHIRQQKLNEKGIKSITKANEDDFNKL